MDQNFALLIGVVCKAVGCFFLALRFIYIKLYDLELDGVRNHNPHILQKDIGRQSHVEMLKLMPQEDIYHFPIPSCFRKLTKYFFGADEFMPVHKYELYNYFTIPLYVCFDAGTIINFIYQLYYALRRTFSFRSA